MADVTLTEEEREAILFAFLEPDHDCAHNVAPLWSAVETIVAARVAAAEREFAERAAQAIEARRDRVVNIAGPAEAAFAVCIDLVRDLMPREDGE